MRYEGVLTKCYYVDVTASTAYKNNGEKIMFQIAFIKNKQDTI